MAAEEKEQKVAAKPAESYVKAVQRFRWVRHAVLAGFVAWSIFVGLEFHRFVRWLEGSLQGWPPERPPAVDAFLPISSLMSFVQLVKTGVVNRVHPAGLVLFILILVLSVAMQRGLCSWVCPFSAVSEWSWKICKRLFGRVFLLPRWLDVPLRGVRYLILGFFVVLIFQMPTQGLAGFIGGSYNRLADVKMYLLFAPPSITTMIVVAALFGLSFFIPNFWCRYLCPYGALLGLVSLASPLRVRRDEESCVACGRCARACPNRIAVDKKESVRSVECTACYTCIETCRHAGALKMSYGPKRAPVTPVLYAAILLGAFLLVSQAARSVGYWQTNTKPLEYRSLYRGRDSVRHPPLRAPREAPPHRGVPFRPEPE